MRYYISTDYMAIYGIGRTPAEAIADAYRGDAEAMHKTDYGITIVPWQAVECTADLYDAVKRHGGAPSDISWSVRDGVATLD